MAVYQRVPPILKPPAIGVSIKVTTAVESGKQNAVIMGRWGTRWDQFGQFWVTTMGHLRDDRNLWKHGELFLHKAYQDAIIFWGTDKSVWHWHVSRCFKSTPRQCWFNPALPCLSQLVVRKHSCNPALKDNPQESGTCRKPMLFFMCPGTDVFCHSFPSQHRIWLNKAKIL